MDFGSMLLMLVVLFVLAAAGSKIFTHFGIPGLIGEIIIGVVIANLVIGDWSLLGMLGIDMKSGASQNYDVVTLFAQLGVMFLLFSIGLGTKVKDLLSVGKAAMMVATMGVVVPLIAGLALMMAYNGDIHQALFLGAAMVATSVGITARVIKDMKLIDTKEAKIIIGAAVIDDVEGMVVLAIVIGMTASGGASAYHIISISVEALLFVVLSIAAALWVVPKIHKRIEKRKERILAKNKGSSADVNALIIAIAVCIGFSWFADLIGLAAIIGAFLGGMLLAEFAHEWKLEERFESITTLFISFFFLDVGMQVDLGSLATVSAVALSAVVILVAIATKYFGCSIGAKLGDKSLSKESRNIIGFGMIPRGEVGIIVATIGLSSGQMSSELYGAVIVMAVATTIIAPPLFAWAFSKKYPKHEVA